jgi:hypothetical protein
MSFFDLVVGKPLATSEERAEHIGPIAGIPVFGLDALSSAAYGPEAALTLLIPLGLAGIQHIVPISFAIIGLLVIVYVSYLQTIDAYPHGGGSYTVASENLGANAGLFAAAALMIDYILNAAVGISAGVGALVSAFPALQPHTLALCLVILLILTVINVRGVKDTGTRRGTSGGCRRAATSACQCVDALSVASGQGLRQRMHGHDRGGGRFERSQRLPRAYAEERQADAYHHHRFAHGLPCRHCVALPRILDRRH